MRFLMFPALAAMLLTSPALAQERAPFTGARVEGIVGYDAPNLTGEDGAGLLYGAGFGFDFQAGGAVLGVEGEASKSNASKCTNAYATAGDTFCSNLGRDLYVGVRAGALIGEGMLIYAKGGYTNTHLTTDYSTGVVGAGLRQSTALDGFRLGVGGEFPIGANAYVKTEYRYSNYEKSPAFVGGTALQPVLLREDRGDRHQLLAGFGFRF